MVGKWSKKPQKWLKISPNGPKDSQIWGGNGQKKTTKNGSKKFKKYTKALHKSSLLLENQPSTSKTMVIASKKG